MKKFLLSILAISATVAVNAQCSDIIISEYVEGSGNDKAIEFYNPTANPIDLASGGYQIQRWSNGANEPNGGGITNLTGVVQPYSTYVLVNGQTTVENGGTSPACNPDLQAMADQLDHAYPAPTYMNGDDALVLMKDGGFVVVDVFGKPGEDPGQAWTDDATAGYTDANGGAWWTKDHTMIRKESVTSGVTEIPSVFNPTLEYDSLPKNTWTDLGKHNCVCDPNNSVNEIVMPLEVSLYPNPVVGNSIFVSTNQAVTEVRVFSITGVTVYNELIENKSKLVVSTEELNAGVYFVEITAKSGGVSTQKVIIK